MTTDNTLTSHFSADVGDVASGHMPIGRNAADVADLASGHTPMGRNASAHSAWIAGSGCENLGDR